MSGVFWALSAGIGFGLFQTLNRRAVRGMGVLVATFLQLLVSALVLAAASLLTQDTGLLLRAPSASLISFALAGLLHFFVGWTFMNASQKRIGAARTSSLIATTPLFGALVAALTLQEIPNLVTVAGILVIVGGVYMVNELKARARGESLARPADEATGFRSLQFGLAAAFCWSLSPIFIRRGLQGLDSPLLGVTVGVGVSALAYALILILLRLRSPFEPISFDSMAFKLVAGVLVGISTWMRWIALDLAPVALVLALTLISVPIVNLLSPVIVGRTVERVTRQVWAGSSLVVAGSLVLILSR